MTVRFERDVSADPDRVWHALTDPGSIEQWLAVAEVDPKIGGEVRLAWPGQGEMRGVVREIDPPRVLEYRWREDAEPSVLRFEVESAADGSVLRLIHMAAPPSDAAGLGAGWQSHLEALDVVVAGGTSSPEDRDARYRELAPAYEAMLEDA